MVNCVLYKTCGVCVLLLCLVGASFYTSIYVFMNGKRVRQHVQPGNNKRGTRANEEEEKQNKHTKSIFLSPICDIE